MAATDSDKLTPAIFYPALLDRLAHVENLRHGIMTVQLAIAGALLGQFFTQDGVKRFEAVGACLPALIVSATTLKLLELMAYNLFVRSMRVASELMIVEYMDGLVARGLGYFAFRRGRSRMEYWISGMAPEVLFLFFVVAFGVLARDVPHMGDLGVLAAILAFGSLLHRHRAVGEVFDRKDVLERECEKTGQSRSLAERLFDLRSGKTPRPKT